MGCSLHPDAVNIPAVAGQNLWFCGFPGCGTPIRSQDIQGGEKKSRLYAMDRWNKAKNPPHKTKKEADTPQPAKRVRGESQKIDKKNERIKGRNRRKKGK